MRWSFERINVLGHDQNRTTGAKDGDAGIESCNTDLPLLPRARR